MTAFRDFDAARAERAAEPLTFRFAGNEWTIDEPPSDYELMGLVAGIADVDDPTGAGSFRAVAAYQQYLRDALGEQWPAFDHAVKAHRPRIYAEDVAELVKWLIESAVGRPFENAEPSAPSPAISGPSSKVVSLGKGSVSAMPSESAAG